MTARFFLGLQHYSYLVLWLIKKGVSFKIAEEERIASRGFKFREKKRGLGPGVQCNLGEGISALQGPYFPSPQLSGEDVKLPSFSVSGCPSYYGVGVKDEFPRHLFLSQ